MSFTTPLYRVDICSSFLDIKLFTLFLPLQLSPAFKRNFALLLKKRAQKHPFERVPTPYQIYTWMIPQPEHTVDYIRAEDGRCHWLFKLHFRKIIRKPYLCRSSFYNGEKTNKNTSKLSDFNNINVLVTSAFFREILSAIIFSSIEPVVHVPSWFNPVLLHKLFCS